MAFDDDKQPHAGGRPPIFATAEQITERATAYFEWIKGEKQTVVPENGDPYLDWKRLPEPPTITGLTLFLGFESRQSFYDYCEKGEFSYALKRFRTMIECKYEQNLHGTTPTGSIFALKNMGWKDKTESDINLSTPPVFNVIMPPGE
jgi:hypothetical protein